VRWQSRVNVHEKVLAANFRGVAIDPDRRILQHLPSGYVVLPAMPRAGDHVALQRALPEWASAMQAEIIDCVKFAADIGNSHRFTFNVEFPHGVRG